VCGEVAAALPLVRLGLENKRALTQKGRCGARTMKRALANQGKEAQTLGIAAQLLHSIATALHECPKMRISAPKRAHVWDQNMHRY
jgi:hypothetical protein